MTTTQPRYRVQHFKWVLDYAYSNLLLLVDIIPPYPPGGGDRGG